MGGWAKVTHQKQFPFSVAVITSGIAITAIIAIWMFVLLPAEPYNQAETLYDFLERTAFSPTVWIGWYLAWILAYDHASTYYQRVLAITGLLICPLVALAFGFRVVQETVGSGSGLEYLDAMVIATLSLFGILWGKVYAIPYHRLREKANS